VLEDGDRYLLIRRAEGLALGGAWCFPGGHLEAGETSCRAVIRELREELGITVVPRVRLGAVRVPGGQYVLAAWLIEYDGAPLAPDPSEVADVAWLTIPQLRAHPGALASNERVLRLLARRRAKSGGSATAPPQVDPRVMP